jgi:hypothetical protein
MKLSVGKGNSEIEGEKSEVRGQREARRAGIDSNGWWVAQIKVKK